MSKVLMNNKEYIKHNLTDVPDDCELNDPHNLLTTLETLDAYDILTIGRIRDIFLALLVDTHDYILDDKRFKLVLQYDENIYSDNPLLEEYCTVKKDLIEKIKDDLVSKVNTIIVYDFGKEEYALYMEQYSSSKGLSNVITVPFLKFYTEGDITKILRTIVEDKSVIRDSNNCVLFSWCDKVKTINNL